MPNCVVDDDQVGERGASSDDGGEGEDRENG